MAALAGIRVLVTRPEGRAAGLLTGLHARGADARHIPLLAVEPLAAGDVAARRTRALAMELDVYQRVIAVSVTAVEYGFEWLGQFWPQLPMGLRWYGIGAATAQALREAGAWATEPGGAMNSEALLALPEFADLRGERVLILRGVGGRPLLADALRARGAKVDLAECYRRLPPAPGAFARLGAWRPDIVCIASGETLTNLCAAQPAALMADLRQAVMVLPSLRVAECARDAGFSRCIVAENAGDAAMLGAVEDAANFLQANQGSVKRD